MGHGGFVAGPEVVLSIAERQWRGGLRHGGRVAAARATERYGGLLADVACRFRWTLHIPPGIAPTPGQRMESAGGARQRVRPPPSSARGCRTAAANGAGSAPRQSTLRLRLLLRCDRSIRAR